MVSRFILSILIYILQSVIWAQVNPISEISVDMSALIHYTDDPCLPTAMVRNINFGLMKKVNLLKIVTCDQKDKKFKGKKYYEVLVDGSTFLVPIDEIQFNLSEETLIKSFRNFDESQRQQFYSNNKSYNDEYFFQIKRERELIQEEEKRRYEEERKLEEDRRAKIDFAQDSITERMLANRLMEHEKTYDTLMDQVDKAITLGQQRGGILITKFDITSNDYGAVGATLGVFNCTQKRIKYVSFKMQAYNPVDDKIGGIESVKGIGFIESKEEAYWEFDNVWFSDVLETVILVSMTVQFEDGSIKTITDVGPLRYDDSKIAFFLKDSFRPVRYNYGSVKFEVIDNNHSVFSLVYFDSKDEIHTVTIIDQEVAQFVIDLEDAILTSVKQENAIHGIFKAKKYLPFIYLTDQEGIGILRIEDAKALLQKLKSF